MEGETSLAEAARAYEDLARSDPANRQYDAWLGNVFDMLGTQFKAHPPIGPSAHPPPPHTNTRVNQIRKEW